MANLFHNSIEEALAFKGITYELVENSRKTIDVVVTIPYALEKKRILPTSYSKGFTKKEIHREVLPKIAKICGLIKIKGYCFK